jgi:hypothetical protein
MAISHQLTRKGYLTLLGFLLFFLGFLSIILGMIGLQFQFMTWMDKWGGAYGFIGRILLILIGFILIIVDQSKNSGSRDLPLSKN